MNPERWDRIQSLFHEAAGRPVAERRTFVEAACADEPDVAVEVLSLLDAEVRGTSLLDRDVSRVARDLVGLPDRALDEGQFHPYRLRAPLGEGGMGVVYLAERPDLGSLVAIKVLRDGWLSPARRRRFASEQRTLARLNHPGIARLYDAHTLADGTPWFVMEYVDGVPLTDYCEAHRLSIADRLRLFRAVCDAVAYAHQHGVIHRDLKPSNILVKPDGTVRLLDFGIAMQVDPAGAAGGGVHTTVRLMTPAYAAPEQVRGEQAGAHTDVYSLGVILYELLTGRLPSDRGDRPGADEGSAHARTPVRPSAASRDRRRTTTASWADLDVLCLTAMHADPARRYPDVASLMRDVDHFLGDEPLEARPDGVAYRVGKFVRRNWQALTASTAVALVVAALALAAGLAAGPRLFRSPAPAGPGTVAVLPFLNEGADADLEHLRLALPEELAMALSYSRSLSVRPVSATSEYDPAALDARGIGRDIGVSSVVTGRFQRDGGQLRVAVEAVDVESGGVLWRDVFRAHSENLIALQQQVSAKAAGLTSALGAANALPITATRPRHEEAYSLYLRGAGGRYDPGPGNTEAIAALERAVALDPGYAPAWLALSRRYYIEARYATGSERLLQEAIAANEQTLELDPNFITARARLTAMRVEFGDLVRAYREAQELVRLRPDSPDVRFTFSYVLRFAGLLDDAARECATALSLDPHNWGWRSCAVVPLAKGDYEGARGYIQLDPGGEWAKAMTIHGLVGAGREAEALAVGRPDIPQWTSYDMLLACVAGRPEAEVAALASRVRVSADPETNYYAAAHLAYCRQDAEALGMLGRAIEGQYCAYPALDIDPFFARVRGTPAFGEVRSQAVACQQAFLAQRDADVE